MFHVINLLIVGIFKFKFQPKLISFFASFFLSFKISVCPKYEYLLISLFLFNLFLYELLAIGFLYFVSSRLPYEFSYFGLKWLELVALVLICLRTWKFCSFIVLKLCFPFVSFVKHTISIFWVCPLIQFSNFVLGAIRRTIRILHEFLPLCYKGWIRIVVIFTVSGCISQEFGHMQLFSPRACAGFRYEP